MLLLHKDVNKVNNLMVVVEDLQEQVHELKEQKKQAPGPGPGPGPAVVQGDWEGLKVLVQDQETRVRGLEKNVSTLRTFCVKLISVAVFFFLHFQVSPCHRG
jgi:hypothetical protein